MKEKSVTYSTASLTASFTMFSDQFNQLPKTLNYFLTRTLVVSVYANSAGSVKQTAALRMDETFQAFLFPFLV